MFSKKEFNPKQAEQQARKEREVGFDGGHKLKTFDPKQRVGTFVLVPKVIEFKLAHQGVDSEGPLCFHPTIGLSPQDSDLLQLGLTTLEMVQAEKSSFLCPRLLFLGLTPPECLDVPAEKYKGSEVYKLNTKIYRGHFLSDYISALSNEKQITSLTFHIAAHGDPKQIGTMLRDGRIDSKLFSELFVQLLDSHPIFKAFKINLVFHSCNSAYCDFSTKAREFKRLMKREVIEKTYIGQVAAALKKEGYSGSVSGFRGYYTPLKTNKAAVVTNKRQDVTEEYLLSKTTFTVSFQPEIRLFVTLPAERKHSVFTVEFFSPTAEDTPSVVEDNDTPGLKF